MKQGRQIVDNYWKLANVSLSKLWHLRDKAGNIVAPDLVLVSFVDGLGYWNSTANQYVPPASLRLKVGLGGGRQCGMWVVVVVLFFVFFLFNPLLIRRSIM